MNKFPITLLILIVVFVIAGIAVVLFANQPIQPTSVLDRTEDQVFENNRDDNQSNDIDVPVSHKETILANSDLDISEWLTYRNEEFGFEFTYADFLNLVDDSDMFNFGHSDSNPQVTLFAEEQTNKCSGCGFYVRVEENSHDLSINEWLESTEPKNDIYLSFQAFNEIKNNPDSEISMWAGSYSEELITLNGIDGLKQNYATEGGGYDRVILPSKRKIIVITAWSDSYYFNKAWKQSQYPKWKMAYEAMLESFNLTKQ